MKIEKGKDKIIRISTVNIDDFNFDFEELQYIVSYCIENNFYDSVYRKDGFSPEELEKYMEIGLLYDLGSYPDFLVSINEKVAKEIFEKLKEIKF